MSSNKITIIHNPNETIQIETSVDHYCPSKTVYILNSTLSIEQYNKEQNKIIAHLQAEFKIDKLIIYTMYSLFLGMLTGIVFITYFK